MTNHTISLMLKEMSNFTPEELPNSSYFCKFLKDYNPSSKDISIVSYIVHKHKIKPESKREERIYNLYGPQLELTREHYNLRNVDMAFWAYKFIL